MKKQEVESIIIMADPIPEVIGVFGMLFLGCFLVGILMEFLCKEHNEPCKPLKYMIDDCRVDSKNPVNNTDVIIPFSLCDEKLPVIDFQKPGFPCVMLTRSIEPVGDLRLTDGAFLMESNDGRRRLKDRYKMEKFMVTYQIRNFTVYNLDSLTGTKVLDFERNTGTKVLDFERNTGTKVLDFERNTGTKVLEFGEITGTKVLEFGEITGTKVLEFGEITGTKVLDFERNTGSTIISRYESKLIPTSFEDKEIPYPPCKPHYIGKCFERISLES
jgi:hypothetical protein